MTTSKGVYDVIVIGAGIEGSSSAYNLVKQGLRVLLLDQFPLPHSRGSSHGQSRITRYVYEDEFYVRMMVDAFPLWSRLEQESGVELFTNCGVLDIRRGGCPGMRRALDALRAHNIPHESLSSPELQRRFPVLTTGQGDVAIWDPNGGLLRADQALRAFQTVFKQLGGVIHDNEPVTSVTPGSQVVIATTKSVYTSANVVFAAGPWSGPLCASVGLHLPLKPIRISVFYWRASDDYREMYGSSQFPCFIDSRGGGSHFHTYGLPISEYPGLVKVCPHEGPSIDPDDRDKGTDDSWTEEGTLATVKSTFKGLATTPSIREYCIYTETPDKHPFLDQHPRFPNIIVAAGFSGHGFKLAPVIGKAVTELVLKKVPTYNMKPFKIDRFEPRSHL
ncbi:unnamed protein product [Candidula unifasciata]|uniref:FAD dependent oxidoreductase domain-containing protein n=1 Tax=Candidula unifasciata TaxID=100452 RepID=A0A8S3ZZ95_9EUPU|nr:unnamed protein product [Candidula unifasciata]